MSMNTSQMTQKAREKLTHNKNTTGTAITQYDKTFFIVINYFIFIFYSEESFIVKITTTKTLYIYSQ